MMDSIGGFNHLGIERLTSSNYPIWKSCMEAYLQGQELWDTVNGNDTEIPEETPANERERKKWLARSGKAMFALKTSIHKDLFDHIREAKTPKEVWNIFEKLFTKKNEARLQFLENELSRLIQGSMSISEYFLKVKNLCAEISSLDPDEAISEAKLKRYIIRGLRKEYNPFVSSLQGWATQPTLVEFENLLSNQEALAKQMAECSISGKDEGEEALLTRGKKWDPKKAKNYGRAHQGESSSSNNEASRRKNVKCYRCGKMGHIKRDCRVKIHEGNVGSKEPERKQVKDWGSCFVSGDALEGDSPNVQVLASINYQNDWIVDSGCSHHLTGDKAKFHEFVHYEGNDAIVTADNTVHPVVNEGVVKVEDGVTLKSVYHVPGMTKNLISVSQVADAGNYILFGPHDVKIMRNLRSLDADVVHQGKRVKSLYVLSAGDSYVEKTSKNDNASLWHARLAHVGLDKMKQIFSKKLVDGVPNIGEVKVGGVCEGCQLGKFHRLPFEDSKSRSKKPLDLIHTDILVSNSAASYSGYKYMLLFVDDYTRFSWVYFLKEKSDTFSKFKLFKAMVEGEHRRGIKCLRSDGGGEYISKEFQEFCREHGIRRHLSCAHTPQQNGVAERKLRHLSEACRCWLYSKNLPKELWAEAMACACHVINRMPLSSCGMKSPFEMLYKMKPSIGYFRVFGSICYVHVPDANRTKFDAKAEKCVFIGYDTQRKGWKCMNPKTHKFITSRDVVFDEMSSYYDRPVVAQNEAPTSSHGETILERPSSILLPSNAPNTSTSSSEGELNESGRIGTSVENSYPRIEVEQSMRRSTREFKKNPRYFGPEWNSGANLVDVVSCFFAGPIDDNEPSCYDEAKGVHEWEKAMEEEISALDKNKTWELVPKPKDIEPVSCKWVYKIKRKADGTVDRYKARLVARGFTQQYGLDYEETFSPVAKMTSVRVLISLAASLRWKMWQLDVKNAFLYGEVDREIYMCQPPGFISKTSPNHVCRLKKAIYGLKQAPRAWYGKIAQYLLFCGFHVSNSDPSMFVKKYDGMHVIVLLYVDDMIVTGDNTEEISKLRDELAIRFEMKNLGELSHFLGLEVEKGSDGIFVSQKHYASKLVERFGLKESKSCSTPMDSNMRLRKGDGKALEDPRLYRTLIGSLLYLTITRPDIAYSVGVVSRFMQVPRKPHLDAAKRILKFVNSSLDLGLLYKKGVRCELFGFTDADWAGDLDERKSTSGYVFGLGSGCVSWCSKKQDTVALSSTEAEYKAATLAAQECVWLRSLVGDVTKKVDYSVKIHCDNQSAIKLAANPVFHARTKHIEVEHHFIREKVLHEEIELMEVRSQNNLADIFTKALPKAKFIELQEKLGLVSHKFALRGSVKN